MSRTRTGKTSTRAAVATGASGVSSVSDPTPYITEEMIERAGREWLGYSPLPYPGKVQLIHRMLTAALAGRVPVALPDPVKVDDEGPGAGSTYWRREGGRGDIRAAVIVSSGVTGAPILMVDGLIWNPDDVRETAAMMLAAVARYDRLAAEGGDPT